MIKNILTVSFPIGLLLCLARIAAACSCFTEPNPPCRAFWETPAVFDGIVIKVTPINESGYGKRSVRFSVENAYRGVKEKEVTIMTGDGGSDCGYTFTEGARYLVYAYGNSGDRLETTYCTRTRPLEHAAEDLQYIQGLSTAPGGATIYGAVKRYAFGYGGGDEDWGLTNPVEGISISIEGHGKTYNLVTDHNGQFHILGLPPGKYSVKALLPSNMRRSIHDRLVDYEANLKDRGCFEARFRVEFEGRISGKVVDDKGQPIKKLKVDLLTADYKLKDGELVESLMDHEYTDEEGRFSFTNVPPGRYLVGIAAIGTPQWQPPYPRTFYPNVNEPSAAIVLEIKANELTGINLRLPAPLIEK